MAERCEGGTTFSAEATTEEIMKVFPNALILPTLRDIRQTKDEGVYIRDQGDVRVVEITGPCPNFKEGGCVFGAPCPIKALINK